MHGRLLQQLLLFSWQRVESRRDDSLHRLRQLTRRPAFREHADVLLGEERVAARAVEQRSLLVSQLERSLEQARNQPRGVLVGQRLERNRCRVRLSSTPALSSLQQLRARRPDHQERDAAEPVDEVVEEVQ